MRICHAPPRLLRTIVLGFLLGAFALTALAQRPDRMKRRDGMRRRPGPSAGTQAPEFTLKTSDAGREVTLSDFRGKRPVVLVFGSYT